MKPFITLICVGLLMSSCASIFCGSKAKVTFDGEISEEATLTIDGLKHTNYGHEIEMYTVEQGEKRDKRQ